MMRQPSKEEMYEEMTKLKEEGKGTFGYLKRLELSEDDILDIQMDHVHYIQRINDETNETNESDD